MERHKCKLCFKSFSNCRAFGGHMRSHLLNISIPPNLKDEQQETESASNSSSSDKEEEGENPKPSSRFVDPEFALVVLQDRESETESSRNLTRRRSKRARKMSLHFRDSFSRMSESWEQPASSVSDTTTEEDVAFCLMMLSRDNKWKQTNNTAPRGAKRYDKEFREEETDESEEEMKCSKTRNKGKYKCETCNKVFNSYQALGGHRASHKKLKLYNPKHENAVTSCSVAGKKIHECPYCFRVFSSGQALGGHKRSHITGLASNTVQISKKFDENSSYIDLNLPAPIDEDDASQIEVSAVSDAEFVNHIKEVSHLKNKL